jgi:erythrin-vacuolar iron transport family protein
MNYEELQRFVRTRESSLGDFLEGEDERVYAERAEGLRQNPPSSASRVNSMRTEESGHRHRPIGLFRQKFGEHI